MTSRSMTSPTPGRQRSGAVSSAPRSRGASIVDGAGSVEEGAARLAPREASAPVVEDDEVPGPPPLEEAKDDDEAPPPPAMEDDEAAPPPPPPDEGDDGEVPPPPPEEVVVAAPAPVPAPAPKVVHVVLKRHELTTEWAAVFTTGIDTSKWGADERTKAAKLCREAEPKAGKAIYDKFGAIKALVVAELAALAAADLQDASAVRTPADVEALFTKVPASRWKAVATIIDAALLRSAAGATKSPSTLQGCMLGIYPALAKFSGDWTLATMQHIYKAFQKVPAGHLSNIDELQATKEVPFFKNGTVGVSANYNAKSYGDVDGEMRKKATSKVGTKALMKRSEYSQAMKKSDLWDVVALHEIGHAVDNRKNIMDSHQTQATNGGWEEYLEPDKVVGRIMALGGSGETDRADLTAVLKGEKSAAAVATARKVKASALPKSFAMAERCAPERGAWADERGAMAAVALQGRVFHRVSGNHYASFLVASKAQAVSHYQFRAPGEWFAELYAWEFSGKLDGHPLQGWVKRMVVDEQPPVPAEAQERAAAVEPPAADAGPGAAPHPVAAMLSAPV